MTDILMPALSPTMEEGTLAKWHVKVGDKISSGDVIAEIETDKATMEVEAVDEGVVEALLVAEGTEGVKVNATIARLVGEAGVQSSSPEAKTSGEGDLAAVEGAKAPAPTQPAPPPSASPHLPRKRGRSEERACLPRRWRAGLRSRRGSIWGP